MLSESFLVSTAAKLDSQVPSQMYHDTSAVKNLVELSKSVESVPVAN